MPTLFRLCKKIYYVQLALTLAWFCCIFVYETIGLICACTLLTWSIDWVKFVLTLFELGNDFYGIVRYVVRKIKYFTFI